MPTDARTANRDYPQIVPANDMRDDAPRLVVTFQMIDADVHALFVAVAGKSDSGHGHAIAAITGLQAALDSKQSSEWRPALTDLTNVDTTGATNGQFLGRISGSWVPVTIGVGNVSGLQAALEGKQPAGAYAQAVHLHAIADITGLSDALANIEPRADIASATTTDIGAASSGYLRVTGTTTITGLGTADAGVERDTLFAGALTLTHNATSLILPGGANITTAAGDTALFRSEGTGNWRCVRYQRASGEAVVAPPPSPAGMTLLGVATPSSVAAVDFTSLITADYDEYVLSLDKVIPATNDVDLYIRVSDDNGATFKATGYVGTLFLVPAPASSIALGVSTTGVSIARRLATADISNSSAGGVSGDFVIRPKGTATPKLIIGQGSHLGTNSGNWQSWMVSGVWGGGNAAIDAVRVLFSSGNIASGTIRFYGRRKDV
ncbi:MAG: hypothetical protein EA385_15010 [Salinarimonadaceae bacterium]|nr:MAG: hypothetical protein EA385_15010 [Salinarimonadaceae bacterium]